MDSSAEDDRAYRAVITYKLGKAILEGLGAVLLLSAEALGAAAWLHQLALGLRTHVVQRLTVALVDLLAQLTTPRAIVWIGVGLGIDALLSGVEGWCLARRYRWASWLVVVTSGLLLPPELLEILEHPSLGRGLLLLINLAVVVVLLRRARRESAQPSPSTLA